MNLSTLVLPPSGPKTGPTSYFIQDLPQVVNDSPVAMHIDTAVSGKQVPHKHEAF